MGEPGGLPSMGLHRVRHDRSNLAAAAATKKKTRATRDNEAAQWMPTGNSRVGGRRDLNKMCPIHALTLHAIPHPEADSSLTWLEKQLATYCPFTFYFIFQIVSTISTFLLHFFFPFRRS